MQYDENAERYGYDGEMTPLKCDELKEVMNVMQVSGERIPSGYYKKSEVDAAIAELKDAWRSEHEACEALKAKLENVQASMYADVVDANMENRRLRRALWLKRADDAKHLVTAYENYDYLDCQKMTIKQETARTWMTCKLRTAEEWVKVWKNIERKCRAKAEEYK